MKYLIFAIFALSGVFLDAIVPGPSIEPVQIDTVVLDTTMAAQAAQLYCLETDLNCISDHLETVERKIKK